jgi:DNA polymerase-1
MKNLLVIDGNSILNRAFYGIRPLSTKSGLPTNAVYGFLNILKKHIDALSPAKMVCAFDRKAPTFRHKMYDQYKATRKGMPEELAMQLPYAMRAAEALGCQVIAMEGYEADDVLGTVSAQAEVGSEYHTYVLTGDRDSLQLVSTRTTVILVKTKEDILYTPEVFREEYGIDPIRLIDVKALMGDTSDNIPGVPGIGEKTALKLIAQAGTLEAVYEDLDTLGLTKSVLAKLTSGRDSAFLSKDLATICRTAPVSVTDKDSVTDKTALNALFDELEFTALKARFLPEGDTLTPAEPAVHVPVFPLYTEDMLLPTEGEIALAVAEDGCIALLCGDTRWIYPADAADAVIREHLAGRNIVCHDYKRLYKALAARDIAVNCVFDTMLAAYLLSPGEGTYPLDKTALRYCMMNIGEADLSAEADTVARLVPVLRDAIAENGMSELQSDMEIPLSEVLSDMEENGFRLDADGLHGYISSLQSAASELATQIYSMAGTLFNLNSPKQLGEILFEKLGLPCRKKTRTGYATDAETLSQLRPLHPIIGCILDYRQLIKLCSTYGENLIALADENGRLHSRFNQTGTATGRISSTDPNMQNIPVRGQLGREMRRYFVASDEEHVLLDADYSQIELRLLSEISGDANMQKAFLEGHDIHTSTASQVFRVPLDEVTSELRSKAKAVNFGIVYGIGDYSLSQDLGITRRQAAEYIDGYLATYPGVDAYLKSTVENAKRDGFTTTMYNRKRNIPELASQNRNIRAFGERVAMNSPIQGTAADIIKIAMIRTRKALRDSGLDAKLILQVHDELIVEASRADAEAAAAILKNEMEHAATTRVPLTVEVAMGQSWYEAKQ